LRATIVATFVSFLLSPSARSDELQDTAQFAQGICGDIPSGSLSKTTIKGAVEANAGAFAKIVSGNVNADASTINQIYSGIPLD
jgi:hypothetical protein